MAVAKLQETSDCHSQTILHCGERSQLFLMLYLLVNVELSLPCIYIYVKWLLLLTMLGSWSVSHRSISSENPCLSDMYV